MQLFLYLMACCSRTYSLPPDVGTVPCKDFFLSPVTVYGSAPHPLPLAQNVKFITENVQETVVRVPLLLSWTFRSLFYVLPLRTSLISRNSLS